MTDADTTIAPRRTGWRARAASWRSDTSDRAVAQRVAGSAYVVRVANAGIAFFSQILLARWMGEYNYGIYAYIWVWLILLSALVPMGLATATQRFIPEYAARNDQDGLRGFLFGSSAIAVAMATLVALTGIGALYLFGNPRPEWPVLVFMIGLACLPLHALAEVQDGVARSHNWPDLAFGPIYIIRPILLLVLVGALAMFGAPANAVWALGAGFIAVAVTSLGQWLAIRRRLRRTLPRGRMRFELRHWLAVSLPMFLIDGFYLLLTYVDVLMVEWFGTPEDVAVYYAATKIMALGAFVSFAVTAATAHRFSEYQAQGDHARIAAFARDAAAWTFWPTLLIIAGLLVMGKPLLWLFGANFTSAYMVLPLLGLGLLARASIGPAERMLSMLGQQNLAAQVYIGAFVINLVLNLVLIPRFGIMGAASATATALIFETVLLYTAARKRLGIHVFAFGGTPRSTPAAANASAHTVELLDRDTVAARIGDWQNLISRAAEPNAFYDPGFALAASRHLKGGAHVRFAVVTHAQGRRLDAVIPLIACRKRFLLPLPLTGVWPAYAPLTTPLLDRDRGADAFHAALDHLADSGHRALFIPRLSDDGAAGTLMRRALEDSGRRHNRFEVHQRALLVTGGDPDERLAEDIGTKRRKEFARLRRRLEEAGPVTMDRAADPRSVSEALQRFMALEESGWKGRHGTALGSDDGRAAFIREALPALAGHGDAEVVLMRAGSRDVAGALLVRQNGRAFYFKTAYDETMARWSPGVLLTVALTRQLLADPAVKDVDSVADADHPMIDGLWRGRLGMADWLVELRPGGGDALFDAVTVLETLRRKARTIAKDVRDRLRR